MEIIILIVIVTTVMIIVIIIISANRSTLLTIVILIESSKSVVHAVSVDTNIEALKWIKVKWKGEGPSPRYSHSAVAGEGGMWVYGGLEGLQARSDLWRWSFGMNSP